MKLHYLLLPFLLFACAGTEQENNAEQEINQEQLEEDLFSQFLSEIPTYNFPVKMSCDYDRLANDQNFEKFLKYYPKGGRLVSKLNSNLDFSLIIFDFECDYSCPLLYTYSKDGIRIDSLNLTPGQCGEDPFMKSREWFIISENLNIQLVDTTVYRSNLEIIDSTSIQSKSYRISSTGSFEIVTEMTNTIYQDSSKIRIIEN